ncbi:MAG TPA: peroxiredoxin-like family protein [Gammaproteobacteria bacterium]|nr:peroxiredoxin-like family protein [Gammaproteobacteria bacterium]
MSTLATEIDELNAAVRAAAPAQVIATIDAATRRLVEDGLAERALGVGQRVPDFALPDAAGRSVELRRLLGEGPLVVKFYRGAWCPYCNLDLRAWQRHLPEVAALGARFVAISPQSADAALTLAEKHALAFPVLSDRGHGVARRFGIVYTLEESLRPVYAAFGVDLPAYNGDSSFELPVPATYLLDRDGTVAARWLDIDYRERVEPADVLARLRALVEH